MRPGALNPRQEAFCQAFIKSRNQSAAYIEAGYSPRGANKLASRLMANDGIQARIADLEAKAAKRNDLTVDAVLRGIKNIAIVAGKIVAFKDKDGNEFDRCVDASNALRAFEDLGKHLGMFAENVNLRLPDLKNLTDEELVAAREKLKRLRDSTKGR